MEELGAARSPGKARSRSEPLRPRPDAPFHGLPMLIPTLSTAPPISEQKPRILAIVDAPSERQTFHNLLTNEGYEVISVGDTDEVFRLAAEFEPDIIVIDVDLPNNAGFEVCGELRANDLSHQTPIVL